MTKISEVETKAPASRPSSIAAIWQWPGMLALTAALILLMKPQPYNLTTFFLQRQDHMLLLLQAACLFLLCQRPRERTEALGLRPAHLLAVCLGLPVICYAGHYLLLMGHALSRDEQMVGFDAAIFASGRIVAALPAYWQAHVSALNDSFMLPVTHPQAWVSGYLPMNALLHAMIGFAGDSALTAPLLVGVGAIALHGCVRILWPDNREAPVVALLLYAGSGQILFTGMTSYAMSTLLTLNLVWLWLFLRNRRSSDFAALAIGFIATGLHQPLFHPLFVLPFGLWLLHQRQWSRVAIYGLGYIALCLFWLLWPQWILTLVSGPSSIAAGQGIDYVSRLIQTVRTGDAARFANMASNLLRFVAWQHMLLIPMVAAALPMIRRGGLPLALAAGAILPVSVFVIILPYQGHGFGYRYLHGVIGNFILLAIYGWMELDNARPAWRNLLLKSSAAGAIILLPVQASMAHALYAPYAAVSRQIDRIPADYVIISEEDASFASDLVINRPDLSNRPIRLLAEAGSTELFASLCRKQPILAFVDKRTLEGINAYFKIANPGDPSKTTTPLVQHLTKHGCRLIPLPAP